MIKFVLCHSIFTVLFVSSSFASSNSTDGAPAALDDDEFDEVFEQTPGVSATASTAIIAQVTDVIERAVPEILRSLKISNGITYHGYFNSSVHAGDIAIQNVSELDVKLQPNQSSSSMSLSVNIPSVNASARLVVNAIGCRSNCYFDVLPLSLQNIRLEASALFPVHFNEGVVVAVTKCRLESIIDMNIVSGSGSAKETILGFFMSNIVSLFESTITSSVCGIMAKNFTIPFERLSGRSDNAPIIPLPPPLSGFSLNLSLTEGPIIRNDTVTVGINGTTLYNNKQSSRDFARAEPQPHYLIGEKMIRVAVSPVILNSFLMQLTKSKLANFNVTLDWSRLPVFIKKRVEGYCMNCSVRFEGGLAKAPFVIVHPGKEGIRAHAYVFLEILLKKTEDIYPREIYSSYIESSVTTLPYMQNDGITAHLKIDRAVIRADNRPGRLGKAIGTIFHDFFEMTRNEVPPFISYPLNWIMKKAVGKKHPICFPKKFYGVLLTSARLFHLNNLLVTDIDFLLDTNFIASELTKVVNSAINNLM